MRLPRTKSRAATRRTDAADRRRRRHAGHGKEVAVGLVDDRLAVLDRDDAGVHPGREVAREQAEEEAHRPARLADDDLPVGEWQRAGVDLAAHPPGQRRRAGRRLARGERRRLARRDVAQVARDAVGEGDAAGERGEPERCGERSDDAHRPTPDQPPPVVGGLPVGGGV